MALAMVRAHPSAPGACRRWQVVRAEGELEVGPWGPIEPGYAVEGGMGCFASAEGGSEVRFPAGDGDGVYPTYAGHLADGSVGALVTEFYVSAVPRREGRLGRALRRRRAR